MSKEEMRDALDHAAASGAIQFSAFSHSFELLSRDRTMANRFAVARLTSLCQAIAGDPRITSGGFAGLHMPPPQPGRIEVAGPRPLRTLKRKISQGVGHLAHDARYVRSLTYVAIISGVVLYAPFMRKLPRSEEHTSELQSLMRISY